MRSLVLGLVLVFCVGVARADGYLVYGAGQASCGTYVSEPDGSAPKLVDLSWALGYISAIDLWEVTENRKFAKVDNNAVGVWLDNYCQAHPLDSFHDAVEHLSVTLAKRGANHAQQQ